MRTLIALAALAVLAALPAYAAEEDEGPREPLLMCSGPPVTRVGYLGHVPDDVTLEEGLAAEAAGNRPESFLIYRSLAERGEAEAQYRLGRMYAFGQVPPPPEAVDPARPDFETARLWYRKAAESGQPEALLSLAQDALFAGDEPDYEEAGALLDRAGDLPGAIFLRAELVARETPADALPLYRHAAEAGSREAMVALSRMACLGQGQEPDLARSLDWWVRANNDAREDDFVWGLYTCPAWLALSPDEADAAKSAALARIPAPPEDHSGEGWNDEDEE
jgi:hypothetical protein